jgi:hypothetical protein
MARPDIGVVHLVRTGNAPSHLRKFTRSYRGNEPGIAHDLIILLKGFQDGNELHETLSMLEGIDCETLIIPDEGYDIAAYFLATRKLEHRYLCFLNSYSILQDPQWLEKFSEHVTRAEVGAVGATGSWQSNYSASSKWVRPRNPRDFAKNLPRYIVRRLRGLILYRRDFAPFPNYHLRTNAFMLPREVMLALADSPVETKWDCLRFESGRSGLTRRIFGMGLQVLVVGKDGKAYEPERWDQSGTFWCGVQSNLLVADNRTIEYVHADLQKKWTLEEFAWGRQFTPVPAVDKGKATSEIRP